jgi:phospholipid/cholesterol/gamma-HCH transport system permease protein
MMAAMSVAPQSIASAATPASSAWLPVDGGWTLRLSGDWRDAPVAALAAPPQPIGSGRVTVDATHLSHWDAALAPALWERLAPMRRLGVELVLDSLPAGVAAVLDLALPEPGAAPVHRDAPRKGWWADSLATARFFGEVLLALGRLLSGRSDMRWSDYVRQIDQTGPLSIPIVSLTCFLVGLMLAYMGGAQLDRIGAQSYIAAVVTVGMVREIAAMMTGVILAGRLGAAFAAQIGSMQANEEIDALRALGVDPIDYLVMPRLLALLTVAPLLLAYASLVGVLAGAMASVSLYGVSSEEYLQRSLRALTWTHLWIGMFKGTLYSMLVALAGCMEGLHAGRNAQAVGEATTSAVVKALVWIVFAASATTMIFQTLKI